MSADSQQKSQTPSEIPGGYAIWQIGLGIALIALWEAAGRATGSHWINRPSSIGARLAEWFQGEIYAHLGYTIAEAAQILGIAPATAEEDWTYAKAWLRRQWLRDEEKNAPG